MDFREYTVVREGKEMVIQGTIREPVHWDFTIRMCEDDLPGITKVALSRVTLGYLVRSLFRRKKDSHWSDSREEHLESVKAAAAEAKKRATEADSTKGQSTKGAVDGEEPDRPKRAPRAPRRQTQPAAAPVAGAAASTNGKEPPASTAGKEPASTNGSSTSAGANVRSNGAGAADAKPAAAAARHTGAKTVSFARQNRSTAAAAHAAPDRTDAATTDAAATPTATTRVGTGTGIPDEADAGSTVTGITDAAKAEAIDAATTLAANTTEGNAQ